MTFEDILTKIHKGIRHQRDKGFEPKAVFLGPAEHTVVGAEIGSQAAQGLLIADYLGRYSIMGLEVKCMDEDGVAINGTMLNDENTSKP